MARPLRSFRGTVQLAAPTLPPSQLLNVPSTPKYEKRTLGNLNEAETAALKNLQLTTGSPLLDRETTYEILGLVRRIGFEQTYAFLTSRQWMRSKDVILALPTLEEARKEVRRDMEESQQKVEAVEGVFKCPYCGSLRTTSVERQMRGCDEPATQIVSCTSCGRKKRY